jgi:two-component system, sensor histidine kinase and response regulator
MTESSHARILIVDDEVRQMTALCDTLRDQNYDVTGYSSSEAGLEALRKSKFDLLLTDLMMPDIDGISLLRSAHEIDRDLVGVLMTGHGTIDTAVEAMKAGALDYILKPFKLSVVLPVLARALTVRQLRLENAALEKRIRERTTELEAANKGLEAANKELEAFSYSVSHDLRAPLRHIDGFSRLLVDGHSASLSPAGQRLLGQVCSAAERLGKLIDDLLNFSRLSRQPLVKRTVSLSNLVQEVLRELEGDREGRNVEIRLGNLPDCLGDAALLKQVFVNLLSNAQKFTRKKEQALIELDCQQKDGELQCLVRDNGAGFDMKYADRLFGVFQRLHHVDQFEGTGVGLSIVQRIIHRHGGRIWPESELDRGTTFHFTLPSPQPDPASRETADSPPPADPSPSSVPQKT